MQRTACPRSYKPFNKSGSISRKKRGVKSENTMYMWTVLCGFYSPTVADISKAKTEEVAVGRTTKAWRELQSQFSTQNKSQLKDYNSINMQSNHYRESHLHSSGQLQGKSKPANMQACSTSEVARTHLQWQATGKNS